MTSKREMGSRKIKDFFIASFTCFSRFYRHIDYRTCYARLFFTICTLLISLVYTFWTPPIDYVASMKSFSSWPTLVDLQETKCPVVAAANKQRLIELSSKEHDKAATEILERIKIGNEWFHRKFVLAGGLLAALIGIIGYESFLTKPGEERNITESINKVLKELVLSDGFVAVLALATSLSLMIDIQVRYNVLTTNQLGMWIAHYCEPLMTSKPFSTTSQAKFGEFLGWEQSLRVPDSMHSDPFFALFHWSSLHALSVILLLALALLPSIRGSDATENTAVASPLVNISFGVVAILYCAFAVCSRTVPGTILISVSPVHGLFSEPVYPAPLAVTIALINALLGVWAVSYLMRAPRFLASIKNQEGEADGASIRSSSTPSFLL